MVLKWRRMKGICTSPSYERRQLGSRLSMEGKAVRATRDALRPVYAARKAGMSTSDAF